MKRFLTWLVTEGHCYEIIIIRGDKKNGNDEIEMEELQVFEKLSIDRKLMMLMNV